MPQFDINFERTGFTDDASIDGKEVEAEQVERINKLANEYVWFPSEVVALRSVSVHFDDDQKSPGIHTFVKAVFLVEAASEEEAQSGDLDLPDVLFDEIDRAVAGLGVAVETDGDWEWTEAVISETASPRDR